MGQLKILNVLGDVIAEVDASEGSGPDLSNMVFDGAILKDLIWEGVGFDQASLAGAKIIHCDFYWGRFFEANLTGAELLSTDLQGADFNHAICRDTRFVTCNLGPDNVGGYTDFCGADLRGAIFQQCVLRNARFNDATLFSQGFHPERHGMQRVE